MVSVPFRVEWVLFAPVIVPTMPIHLDALLSWARVHEAELAGDVNCLALQHDLPLDRHETEQGWCFKASALSFDYASEPQQLHYIRRSDIDGQAEPFARGILGQRMPVFDPKRGMHKAGSFTLTQRFTKRVEAYGVGDVARVQEMLQQVTSLGKLRRRGKGAVRSFTVVEVPEARDRWARRNLPVGSPHASGGGYALVQQRLHAPYWDKQRQMVLAPVDF